MKTFALHFLMLLLPIGFLSSVKADSAADQCMKMKVEYERKCGITPNPNNFTRLIKAGACAEVTVLAKSHWNASTLLLEKDKRYRFEVIRADGVSTTDNGASAQWCDGSIVTDVQGWYIKDTGNQPGVAQCPKQCDKCRQGKAVQGPAVNLGRVNNAMINSATWLKRKTDSRWFAMIGVVGGENTGLFEIDNGLEYSSHVQGEFCSYANDVSFKYGNNSGAITLRITALE